jgi:hypothetical protein
MKNAIVVVSMLALAGLAGCVSPGTAEDFKWTAECPKTVDKGSEFNLTINATKESEEGIKPIEGVPFTYQVHWTGGSSAPLRHLGYTGEAVKIRARMVLGPATILITSANKDKLDVKVLETAIEVK